MADDPRPATSSSSDEDILKELRARFEYATAEWDDIRTEGKQDMLCCSGEVWQAMDPGGVKQRKATMRPMLSPDELSQYVNQLINDVRQNKRAIQVTATGTGANDDTAELHASLIRQIEYRSNAQQAYTCGFENAVQRSYGFWRITPKYVRDDSFDQELLIEPLVNPDLVTVDPDALKPDGSDMRYAFIRESRSKEEFRRDFPQATIRDFDADTIRRYPAWVSDTRVNLAEYWTLETKKRELLLIATTEGERQVFADELHTRPSKQYILKTRDVDSVSVKKYVTNGLELLERTDWPGSVIPIVCCYGKVLWVDDGAGAKRKLLSLIRLARDPAMYYAYIRTSQAEAVGKVPKTPAIGYEGQFRGHESEWEKANHEPVAFLEARPTTEATGSQLLPLPAPFPGVAPELHGLEILAEGARRAIQAAIGQSPLPTQAQRRNEKSGVALKQIEETAQKGSFHFIDHYDEAITRTGAILEDLLPHYYDTVRDVALRNPDDSTELARINDPAPVDDQGQPTKPKMVTDGPHDITLSTGPHKDSEREVANEFADLFVEQLPLIAQVAGPPVAAKMMALAIRLKNIGPLGDEMADLISPPEDQQPQIPPEVQAKMQEMGQALQQAQMVIQTDQAKQQATIEKAHIDTDADLRKAGIDAATKIKIAEIQAQTAIATAEIKAMIEDWKARLAHIEEIVGHSTTMAVADSRQQHEAQMGERAHAQALEQGDQSHQQALEQGEQTAQMTAEQQAAQQAHEASLAEQQAAQSAE